MSPTSTAPIVTEFATTKPVSTTVNSDHARLREAAQAFEALFMQTLLRQMREAQLEEGFFGQGAGASGYEAIFEDLMARQSAGSSPLGIASLLESQWSGTVGTSVDGVEDALRRLGADHAYRAAGRESGGSTFISELRAEARPALPSRRTTRGVSSGFGMREDPIDGGRRFHSGVDLPAPAGTPVLAVAPGRVRAVLRHPAYGLHVEIDHAEGWTTRYAHLSEADVQAGQLLHRGQALGKVGATGRTTGPHLHFEAAQGGRQVDPAVAAPGRLDIQVLGRAADE